MGHLRSTCRKEPACFKCGLGDHKATNCPHKDKTCKQCGKVGHLAITCRQSAAVALATTPAIACFTCGGPHKAAACPKGKQLFSAFSGAAAAK